MHLSAFDVIQHLAKRQNPRQAFSNLVEIVSEVVLGEDNLSNLSDFTFPGPGQRPTASASSRCGANLPGSREVSSTASLKAAFSQSSQSWCLALEEVVDGAVPLGAAT